jgi:hypothetical protein
MAKPLAVLHKGKSLAFNLEKVDRSKLYGYVDAEVLDEQSRRCELATLNGDGRTLVGRGGTALGLLSPNGLWRERSTLQPVDLNGKTLTPVKSTLDAAVPLEQTATIDEYLAHNIQTVYHLIPEGDATELVADLRVETIYTFPFSYRGGLEAHAGFLLLGADDHLFLAIGNAPSFQFVGLKQTAALAEDEADGDEEDDALDFGMM